MDPAGSGPHSQQPGQLAVGGGQRVVPAGPVEPAGVQHAVPQGRLPLASGHLRAAHQPGLHHLQVPAAAAAIVLTGFSTVVPPLPQLLLCFRYPVEVVAGPSRGHSKPVILRFTCRSRLGRH